MESIERITTTREPPVPAVRPLPSDEDDDTTEREPRPAPAPAARSIVAEGRIFQARLSYDYDREDVIVEILDPVTGEVVRSLPADRAARDDNTFRSSGALLDRVA